MATRVLYFAWLRERIGMAEETFDLPDTVATVVDLLGWLAARSDGHAHALDDTSVVRVALDQTLVDHDTPLGTTREIALFPPMTGG